MKVKQLLKFMKIFLLLFILIFIINFISGYFSERVKTYVIQKAKLEAASIIADAITESVLPNIDLDNLIKTTAVGTEIDSIFINTYQINQIMSETIKEIQEELSRIESNEILNNLTLPFNIIVSEIFFSGYGPKINIEIYPLGSVICDVITSFDNYGINNTLLEISIIAKVKFVTVIPLQRQEIEVDAKIPIVVQIIQGKVPIYYYNNTDSEFLPNPIA